uniref:Chemokine (C-C motif) ligand 19b n=1 Tax=Hucho hucho TaxID=62062 RepID=A0A4W5PDQ9_9TELE
NAIHREYTKIHRVDNLTCVCVSAANTNEARDCCLTTTDNKLPRRVVKSFSIQTVSGGCRIPATVFVTRKNLRLCAPPATNNNWVTKLIKQLKRKSQNGKARKGKNGGILS